MNLLFFTYQLLQIISFPIVVIYLLLRPIRKKPTIGNLWERLGFVPRSRKSVFWIHAVSVGEILSIQSLVENIKKNPNNVCYITTGTITGKTTAIKNINADYVSLMPFDFFPFMSLAMRRIKPKKIIIVEAEIWPNFIMIANKKKIPLYLINARISNRSKKQYHLLKRLLSPLLNKFKKIYAQSIEDASRFKELGIQSEKIQVLGDLKTFNVTDKHRKQPKFVNPYPTILVGSLHKGEFQHYINLYKSLKCEFKNLKLILAPRHFHWKKKVINNVKQITNSYHIWDDETTIENAMEKDIILVFKLGILFNLYPISNVFCLGGTFVPIGGHNLLEPSVWSKVSVIGPHFQNCKITADALQAENALIKVKNENELIRQVRYLLKNNNIADTMGQNAKKWLDKESVLVKTKALKFVKEIT